jgi:hypothetical protein
MAASYADSLCSRKRESNQRESAPYIRVSLRSTSLVPMLLRGSARRAILAQHASFGILPNAPLHNTCTRPPDGGIWTESFGDFLLGFDFFQIKSQCFAAASKSIRAGINAPFQQAERNRCVAG